MYESLSLYASLNAERTQVRMLMKIASPYVSLNAKQTPVRKPVYMQVYMPERKFQSECSVKSLCEYQLNTSLNDMSVSQSVEYASFWKRFLRKRTAVCLITEALQLVQKYLKS